jgi:hypothetical protein
MARGSGKNMQAHERLNWELFVGNRAAQSPRCTMARGSGKNMQAHERLNWELFIAACSPQ